MIRYKLPSSFFRVEYSSVNKALEKHIASGYLIMDFRNPRRSSACT